MSIGDSEKGNHEDAKARRRFRCRGTGRRVERLGREEGGVLLVTRNAFVAGIFLLGIGIGGCSTSTETNAPEAKASSASSSAQVHAHGNDGGHSHGHGGASATGKPKRGIVPKDERPGDLRSRFPARLRQLTLTYDIAALNGADLVKLLGREFERWQR